MNIFKRMSRTLTEVGPTLRVTLFRDEAAQASMIKRITTRERLNACVIRQRRNAQVVSSTFSCREWFFHSLIV